MQVAVLASSKKQDLAASILREVRDNDTNRYREGTVIRSPHNVAVMLNWGFFVADEAKVESAENCKGI